MAKIHDVARRAGVSPGTVSNVFNHPQITSNETRERVLAAARELNYQPNMFARALSGKKTDMVGIIIPDIQYPFSAIVCRGVEDEAKSHSVIPVIASTDGDPNRELNTIQQLYQRGIRAFIIAPVQFHLHPRTVQYLNTLIGEDVSIILIGNHHYETSIPNVKYHAQAGSRRVVEYLHAHGHRRIGFIGGRFSQGGALERWLGYQEGVVVKQLLIDPQLIIEKDLSYEGGRDGLAQLLDLKDPPTAVFAANDLMAVGALNFCYERGIRVPEELSIVGFDDLPIAALTAPSLTTVRVPMYEMGQRAMRALLQPENQLSNELLDCPLVIRSSTTAIDL